MRSKSKYEVSHESITMMFEKAGIKNAGNIAPLGAGEFNSVYSADAGGKKYAIKIAPNDVSKIMTYERDMMAQEVYYYSLMEDAGIRVPKIYSYDFSKTIIPTEYFIMERLEGEQLDKVKLNEQQKELVKGKLIEMVAKMHTVKGDKFGYRQNGQCDNWYLAISDMVINLIKDCQRMGRSTHKGQKLKAYIDKNKEILENVECALINFDIWPPNIFVRIKDENLTLAWIDPERSLFGDRISDFVCIDFMNMSLDSKSESIKTYNKVAGKQILIRDNERIRLAVMTGYLALIMEVERYARYSVLHFGYWRNAAVSKMLFKNSFSVLRELTKE